MAISSHATGSLGLLGFLIAHRCTIVGATGIDKELLTTNVVCSANNCINPLFPALEDLGRLEKEKWVCQDRHKMMFQMAFCQEAVRYPSALIVPDDDEGQTISQLVQQQ